jgi:hypothetical protein
MLSLQVSGKKNPHVHSINADEVERPFFYEGAQCEVAENLPAGK